MTLSDAAKPATDLVAAGTVGATWMGWLPDVLQVIGLLLTIVWFLMRMYDWIREKLKHKE